MSFKEYQAEREKSKGRQKPFRKSGGSSRGSSSRGFNRDSNRNSRSGSGRSFGGNSSGSSRGRFSDRKFSRDKPRFDPNLKEQFTPIKFSNTYLDIKRRGVDLFTKNLTPGISFFGERTFHKNVNGENVELRNWEYKRSKLGSAIVLKVSQLGLKEGAKVLYLGASHGFTPSFVSDMVGPDGFVFCLDFAPRVVRDLYLLCQKRNNMAPIIADANAPETYEKLIPEVDVIFMDIAQRDQVGIFLKNIKFLKEGGFGLLALKARSVDVTKNPKDVFKIARAELEEHLMIVDYKELDPYEKDHCFFVCKKK